MVGRIIETEACVAEGVDWLCAAEPRFAEAVELTGPLPLRRRPDGFAQLLSAIVSQQVSVASARAIWARLEAAGMTTPEAILATDGPGCAPSACRGRRRATLWRCPRRGSISTPCARPPPRRWSRRWWR